MATTANVRVGVGVLVRDPKNPTKVSTKVSKRYVIAKIKLTTLFLFIDAMYKPFRYLLVYDGIPMVLEH